VHRRKIGDSVNASPEAAQFTAGHINLMFNDPKNVSGGSISDKNPFDSLNANQNFLYSGKGGCVCQSLQFQEALTVTAKK
jgi:hypothetical protein